MTKEELATERNEVREILEDFSEELSQSNLNKLSRVFCIINGDEKRIAELEAQIEKMKCCENCKYYKPCVTVNETIGNECEDFYNGCNNSVIAPFRKWEIKEK